MDTFFAFPTSTTYTPLTPSAVIVENVITPIIPRRPFMQMYPKVVTNYGLTSLLAPSTAYFYDSSGIGENPLAQHETNTDLRYKFLDKWLYEDFPDIVKMLKVVNGQVDVLSENDAKDNDISNDDEDTLMKKSDFIGHEILTISKNLKILTKLVQKNNIKFYDLPYNEHFVKKEQGKYVKGKLKEMRK